MTERCDDCSRRYTDVYRLPDGLWAELHERAPAGMLCMACVTERARAKGMPPLFWEARVGEFPLETPS